MRGSKLPLSFYTRSNVVLISKELLGKHLFSRIGGRGITGGIIVETEAYAGPEDKASHAWNNRRTRRTEIMFHSGGVAYVYFCYGMHNLFNIVTNVDGIPHAVLVRAICPTHGIPAILGRRGRKLPDSRTAGGPGSLTQALGITTAHNGTDLLGNTIWLEDRGLNVPDTMVKSGPRIGVDYAGDWAVKEWRFWIDKADIEAITGGASASRTAAKAARNCR